MLGWFQALLPKEDSFFDLFEQHARLVLSGAGSLRDLLKGGEQVEQHRQTIFNLESQADDIARQVLTAVRRTFITPFERTDIQDLIHLFTVVIDQMNKTAQPLTRLD